MEKLEKTVNEGGEQPSLLNSFLRPIEIGLCFAYVCCMCKG